MPIDDRSPAERLSQEMGGKRLSEILAKQSKPQPKPETCPYCGSAELEQHHVPMERTLMWVHCLNCGKEWDKE